MLEQDYGRLMDNSIRAEMTAYGQERSFLLSLTSHLNGRSM